MDDAGKQIVESFAEIDNHIKAARQAAHGGANDLALNSIVRAVDMLRDKVVELAVKVDNLEAAADV